MSRHFLRAGILNAAAPVPPPSGRLRGINVADANFGSQPSQLTDPETLYGSVWQYDSQATFTYLASRGITLIRLPILWEHLQRSLGAPLDTTLLQHLQDAVTRIGNTGMKVILDLHNYGHYATAASGYTAQLLGQGVVTDAHFIDFWSRISAVFKNTATVHGYGLMNEPSNCYPTSWTAADRWAAWRNVTQQVLTTIRGNSDQKRVFVMKMNIDGQTHNMGTQNPTAWLTDPANNFAYEFHHYSDTDRSGTYTLSYATEVANAQAAGFPTLTARSLDYLQTNYFGWFTANNAPAFLGEYGVPADDADASNWAAVADGVLTACTSRGIDFTWWGTSEFFHQYKLAPYVQASSGQPISVARPPMSTTLENHL